MRFTSLFPIACLLLLAVLSTAWQLDGLLSPAQLLPRQDDSDTTTAADSATTGATPTADDEPDETATSTSSSDDDSEETNTASVTSTKSADETKTTSHSNKTTSVDARLPPGGISMLTPASSSTTYYKIDEEITFVWNYTSLSITPSAINVVASCSLNDATYTIASNVSVEETQTVKWDTGKFNANATAPLLTATYTLIVWDDSKDIDDSAKAGELSSQNRYYFGMYTPQPYENLTNFVCATCNGALSSVETLGLKMAVGMSLLTIVSFTWFAGTFGVFST
ncbi:uncharacterized protein BDV17DRAFT_195087 [Aspergillus undulatus]|uniref:uncharacterized protein n=1 Tax=Aspergillus undulatus TaxID=1810928 RepID=UPI003CCCDEEA